MSASVFEEQGIEFKVITPDMYEDVLDFLWTHFFPAEPVSRSLGLKRLGFLDKYVLPDAFRQGCSMVALDRNGVEQSHWSISSRNCALIG